MDTVTALHLPGDSSICTVAALIKDGCILMGWRHYSETEVYWTLPGGRTEIAESVGDALRREIAEEVAITKLENITFLGEVTGTHAGDRLMVFMAKTDQEYTLMEPEKFSTWKWVPLTAYCELGEYSNMNLACMELVKKSV